MKWKEVLPPILYNEALHLYQMGKFALVSTPYLKANASLHNSTTSESAFLIATGPSIREQNLLELINGRDCFSVSNFFLHPDINKLKPKLHFFAPYHPPLVLSNFIEWLREADSKLPKETDIVLGHTDYEMVQKEKLFINRKVYYLYLSYNIVPKKIDLMRPVLAPQSGPLMILPVLLAMGYKQINLLGCDHTVLRDFKKPINHFYDTTQDSRKNASDTNSWMGIISALESNLNVFKQYKKYKEAIDRYYPDIKVVNLSQDSWLDIF